MFLLIKNEKNIVAIINASNSSSDFCFGHFVEANDIPQSSMLSFSSKIQILTFLKLFKISSNKVIDIRFIIVELCSV